MKKRLRNLAKRYISINNALVTFKNWIFIILGVLSAGFGLKSFLLPNHFIDGGATGISLLVTQVSELPFAIVIITVNIPFLIMGYKTFGKSFLWKTAIAIIGLALVATFFPYPIITQDKLLVATFGGFFLGAGIGMAMRGGGVLDGSEILALGLSKRLPATLGDIILLINIIIFSFAAYILGIESALYSVLTYLVASKAVDFFVEGIEEYTGITIVSNHHVEEISNMIVENFGRGITMYKGSKGHGKRGTIHRDTDIIYCVVTRMEVTKVKYEIAQIDPHAFVAISSIREVAGGMVKKRPLSMH